MTRALLSVRRWPSAAQCRSFLTFLAWRKSRIDLGRLDDHMLRDIGLPREAAFLEAGRPIWSRPSPWWP